MFDDVLIHQFKRDPKLSKSSYCNMKGCRDTEVKSTMFFENELFLCRVHQVFALDNVPENKSDFVYWAAEHVKRSVFKGLNKS
jgi:hypothetical protein